jgi:hypothetical protein
MNKGLLHSYIKEMESRIQDYWFLRNRMGEDHGIVNDAMSDIINISEKIVDLTYDQNR